jgi:hypothetical protein
MYKCIIYDTTRFKGVIVMNLSELCSEACFCESNPRMGDLLRNLVWGAKSGQCCVIGGGSLQIWLSEQNFIPTTEPKLVDRRSMAVW